MAKPTKQKPNQLPQRYWGNPCIQCTKGPLVEIRGAVTMKQRLCSNHLAQLKREHPLAEFTILENHAQVGA